MASVRSLFLVFSAVTSIAPPTQAATTQQIDYASIVPTAVEGFDLPVSIPSDNPSVNYGFFNVSANGTIEQTNSSMRFGGQCTFPNFCLSGSTVSSVYTFDFFNRPTQVGIELYLNGQISDLSVQTLSNSNMLTTFSLSLDPAETNRLLGFENADGISQIIFTDVADQANAAATSVAFAASLFSPANRCRFGCGPGTGNPTPGIGFRTPNIAFDNVVTGSLNPIPIPGAAWMMLSGLGAAGLLARRRRRGKPTLMAMHSGH